MSEENKGQQFADYRGLHRAPSHTYGSPLHDLSGGDAVYPADVYGPHGKQYYGSGDPHDEADAQSFRAVHQAHGDPDHMTWVHRALPKDAPYPSINPGDWVTTSKAYAKEHGEGSLQGNYRIGSMRVPAKHLYTEGNSISEWGYDPGEGVR